MRWGFSSTPLRWIIVWVFVVLIIIGAAMGWLS